MLLHLQDNVFAVRPLDHQGVVDSGEFQFGLTARYIEMYVHYRSHDLRDVSYGIG